MPKHAFPVLIAALAALVFLPGLGGPFVLDDHVNLAPVWEWLHGTRSAAATLFDTPSGPLGRPVAYLTLMANAALSPAPFGFKLVNLTLHLIAALLLWRVLLQLLPAAGLEKSAAPLALLLTAIWALHPLQVSTVQYVVQRMTVLAAIAQLAALWLYLEARRSADANEARARKMLWLGVPACLMAGMLAKESAVLAAPLLLWIEAVLSAKRAAPPVARRFVFALGAAFALALLAAAAAGWHWLPSAYLDRGFTLLERLATELRVMGDYALAILLPGFGHLGLYRDGYPTAQVASIASAAWLAGWLSLAALGVLARKRWPLAALGIGWFLICHALESTVLPLEPYFEHRNYLALLGPWLALAGLLPAALLTHRAGRLAGAALVAGLALATLMRNWHWRDLDALYAAEAPPQGEISRRLQIDRGIRAYEFGDTQGVSAALAVLDAGSAGDRATAALWRVLFACDSQTRFAEDVVQSLLTSPPPLATHNQISALELLARRQTEGRCRGLPPGTARDVAARWLESPATQRSPYARTRIGKIAAPGEASP